MVKDITSICDIEWGSTTPDKMLVIRNSETTACVIYILIWCMKPVKVAEKLT